MIYQPIGENLVMHFVVSALDGTLTKSTLMVIHYKMVYYNKLFPLSKGVAPADNLGMYKKIPLSDGSLSISNPV